jgi:hypothetical protein
MANFNAIRGRTIPYTLEELEQEATKNLLLLAHIDVELCSAMDVNIQPELFKIKQLAAISAANAYARQEGI